MSAEQTAINHRALMSAAAKVERIGYDGDPFRFVESLVASVLADGYRPIPPPPPLRGRGADPDHRKSCKAEIDAALAARRRDGQS